MDKQSFEQSLIEKILIQTITEQRRSRRWRIFFRFIFLILIGSVIYFFNQDRFNLDKVEKQVATIELSGVINSENQTYQNVSSALEDALKDKQTLGVIIRANSPGGSPVYSNMLFDEILRLRKLYPKKPIDVVVEEVCASGCYYIASAANKIYANPSSIVGSIGVIYTGFGATALMQKLGIDSRLLISGKNKAMGYPFIPKNPEQEQMQQKILDEVHEQFIAAVKQGRGKALKLDTPDLFSGRYWIGEEGLKIGLIDGYETVNSLARNKYHTDNIVDFTVRPDPLDKISKKLGVGVVSGVKQELNVADIGSFN